jgi:hypothetical protein
MAMTQDIYCLMCSLRDNILEDFIFPDVIATNDSIADTEEIQENFAYGWQKWGSDTEGGFAYFGYTQDIHLLEAKIIDYLKLDNCNDNQYYAKWDLPHGFSLIMLYDYSFEDIFQDNVLCVSFGSNIDDEVILSVLENKLYIDDGVHWHFGYEKVLEGDVNQMQLVEKMKQMIELIDDPNLYNILKEKALLDEDMEQVAQNKNGIKL